MKGIQPFKCLKLLPWESTALRYGLIFVGIFFLALVVWVLLFPKKKESEEKWHSVFCWIGLIFVSAFTLFAALTITFLVETTLGWWLALLAGVSVVLGAVSLIAGFIGAFIRAPAKYLILWGFLGVASFLSVLFFGLLASPC